jgi:hypothetical protein
MKAYHIALIVFGVGLVGGLANALYSGNTFLLPKADSDVYSDVYIPGLLVTAFLGGIAAVVSWGLYGANASKDVNGNANVTISALAGALLIGFGGARWLTNESDKSLLNKTASIVASKPTSDATAAAIRSASPMQALEAAKQAPAN